MREVSDRLAEMLDGSRQVTWEANVSRDDETLDGVPIDLGGSLTWNKAQQVELSGDRLDIGIVTHARYIRETVEMLDGRAPAPVDIARTEPAPRGAVAASAEALGRPR